MKNVLAFVLLFTVLGFNVAHAAFIGKVDRVDATEYPTRIKFQMDNGEGNCFAGNWVTWEKSIENNKGIYSLLMSALVSRQNVKLYHSMNGESCFGDSLQLVHSG